MRSLIDPRAWWGLLRLLHYHNYSHVTPRREVSFGLGVRLAPNVSLANGERIAIGDRTHVGAHSSLWAGRREGRIDIGEDCLLGPEVFVTAANYRTDPGTPVWRQDTVEDDVTIGSGVWLGARVMVLPGVDIGDGAVVGAGSVVTRSLPPNAIAVGNPARVIGSRVGRSHSAKAA